MERPGPTFVDHGEGRRALGNTEEAPEPVPDRDAFPEDGVDFLQAWLRVGDRRGNEEVLVRHDGQIVFDAPVLRYPERKDRAPLQHFGCGGRREPFLFADAGQDRSVVHLLVTIDSDLEFKRVVPVLQQPAAENVLLLAVDGLPRKDSDGRLRLAHLLGLSAIGLEGGKVVGDFLHEVGLVQVAGMGDRHAAVTGVTAFVLVVDEE